VEWLGRVEVAEFSGAWFGTAGGVVVVAEDLVAESGRAALVAGGVDVTAAGSGLGDGGFGLV
jgi:hypothetical protein